MLLTRLYLLVLSNGLRIDLVHILEYVMHWHPSCIMHQHGLALSGILLRKE